MPADLSPAIGIGLRSKHIRDFEALRPALPFVEIHAENHLCGGAMRQVLHRLRRDYAISMHCVGMSLGSKTLDKDHIARIKSLVDEIDPFLVSDHLSISTMGAVYTNDLVPLPYSEEALSRFCAHVERAQEMLGRQLLIENPSRYVSYVHSTLTEGEFLDAVAKRTGCALLCDVNNIFVTARNEGQDPQAALAAFPMAHVREFHLAGHDTVVGASGTVRIDTHDRPVCEEVWHLFEQACRSARAPALIEWDNDLPELGVLLGQAAEARAIRAKVERERADAA
jgi:uncharacterized protein (UPF0276 family)